MRTDLPTLLDSLETWHPVPMRTGRAWQLRSGPIDRMVILYASGDVMCRTRDEGDVITTAEAARAWVLAATPEGVR